MCRRELIGNEAASPIGAVLDELAMAELSRSP